MGYAKARDYLNFNGITTVADMSTGNVNWDLEIGALKRTFDREDSPVRVRLTPDAIALAAAMKNADTAFAFIGRVGEKNTRHVFTNKAIKLFADGAMFSQLMQLSPLATSMGIKALGSHNPRCSRKPHAAIGMRIIKYTFTRTVTRAQ